MSNQNQGANRIGVSFCVKISNCSGAIYKVKANPEEETELGGDLHLIRPISEDLTTK